MSAQRGNMAFPVSFKDVFYVSLLMSIFIGICQTRTVYTKEDLIDAAKLAEEFGRPKEMGQFLSKALEIEGFEATLQDLQLLHRAYHMPLEIRRDSWQKLSNFYNRNHHRWTQEQREFTELWIALDEKDIGELCDSALEAIELYYPKTVKLDAGTFGYIYRGDFHRYKMLYKKGLDRVYFQIVAEKIYLFAKQKVEDRLAQERDRTRAMYYELRTLLIHKLVAFYNEEEECQSAIQLLTTEITKVKAYRTENPHITPTDDQECFLQMMLQNYKLANFNQAALFRAEFKDDLHLLQ